MNHNDHFGPVRMQAEEGQFQHWPKAIIIRSAQCREVVATRWDRDAIIICYKRKTHEQQPANLGRSLAHRAIICQAFALIRSVCKLVIFFTRNRVVPFRRSWWRWWRRDEKSASKSLFNEHSIAQVPTSSGSGRRRLWRRLRRFRILMLQTNDWMSVINPWRLWFQMESEISSNTDLWDGNFWCCCLIFN